VVAATAQEQSVVDLQDLPTHQVHLDLENATSVVLISAARTEDDHFRLIEAGNRYQPESCRHPSRMLSKLRCIASDTADSISSIVYTIEHDSWFVRRVRVD
jgi:hypothetical protein